MKGAPGSDIKSGGQDEGLAPAYLVSDEAGGEGEKAVEEHVHHPEEAHKGSGIAQPQQVEVEHNVPDACAQTGKQGVAQKDLGVAAEVAQGGKVTNQRLPGQPPHGAL